jgi:uncharacterized protein YndB with AHSA1/START domain
MGPIQREAEAVEVAVRVKASPETLWGFLTEPEKMVRWQGRRAELDPRPGGGFMVEINDQAVARGEYVELEPPSRLVLTWGWEGHAVVPPGSTRLEISLEPDGEETVVRFRHLGIPSEERAIHTHGWEHYLGRLEIAGSGGEPGPDPNATGGM